ncbi:MAG: M23 family metallopeptidase [Candidatus Dormibacteraeota bacterium]|nr:M23 family metallopeptidase [Candidatus Dormibacteraeota bacterium]
MDEGERRMDGGQQARRQARRRWGLLAGLALGALGLLACGFRDNVGQYTTQNAYWSCPSATPWPSATPYGREFREGGHRTQNIFYAGQDVRWGPLRLTYDGAQAGAVLTNGQQVWLFQFATANESRALTATLDVAWPARVVVREVARADGTTLQHTWQPNEAAYRAAGLARWQDSDGHYAPGQRRTIVVPVLVAAGTPAGVGVSLDQGPLLATTPGVSGPPGVSDPQQDLDTTRLIWFVAGSDPYCQDNTSGPVGANQGGAVWSQAVPPTPRGSYSLWSGWPMAGAMREITQPFGCTKFPEATGYPCPGAGQPADYTRFHKGIDFGLEEGTVVQSVSWGRVILVGDSRRAGYNPCECPPGDPHCVWEGSKEPHYNLGYAVFVQVGEQQNGGWAPSDLFVKYGHLIKDSSDRFGIAIGDYVVPGQPLGLEGTTGCSSGPHLHLEFSQGQLYGPVRDPMNFLGPNRGQRGP